MNPGNKVRAVNREWARTYHIAKKAWWPDCSGCGRSIRSTVAFMERVQSLNTIERMHIACFNRRFKEKKK